MANKPPVRKNNIPGIFALEINGWSWDEIRGDCTHQHMRFQVDAIFDREAHTFQKQWKLILEVVLNEMKFTLSSWGR